MPSPKPEPQELGTGPWEVSPAGGRANPCAARPDTQAPRCPSASSCSTLGQTRPQCRLGLRTCKMGDSRCPSHMGRAWCTVGTFDLSLFLSFLCNTLHSPHRPEALAATGFRFFWACSTAFLGQGFRAGSTLFAWHGPCPTLPHTPSCSPPTWPGPDISLPFSRCPSPCLSYKLTPRSRERPAAPFHWSNSRIRPPRTLVPPPPGSLAGMLPVRPLVEFLEHSARPMLRLETVCPGSWG